MKFAKVTRRRVLALSAGAAVALRGSHVAGAQGEQPPAPGSRTLLIGGLDSRDEAGPHNTDVIILARVDDQTGVVRVVNIPRDLYVMIPDVGGDRINRAFDLG